MWYLKCNQDKLLNPTHTLLKPPHLWMMVAICWETFSTSLPTSHLSPAYGSSSAHPLPHYAGQIYYVHTLMI